MTYTEDFRRQLAISVSIERLREVRDLLVAAGAPRAADKVRKALKSAEGAQRNASVRQYRVQR